MKISYRIIALSAVALMALGIALFGLRKCNSENRTLGAGAHDPEHQVNRASSSSGMRERQSASTPSVVENAAQHDYVLEKVEAGIAAESNTSGGMVGRFASSRPNQQTIEIARILGSPYQVSYPQISPDELHVLYFDKSKFRWQVWAIQGNSPSRMVAELPKKNQLVRCEYWHWLDNDRLIGEYHTGFSPDIEGYENEGWTESTTLHVFDLTDLAIGSVAWPPPLPTASDRFEIDPLSDGNVISVPYKRYYSMHFVSDQAEVNLVSLDTKEPEGSNLRDEGWFTLRKR